MTVLPAIAALIPFLTLAAPTFGARCVGDCNGDGMTTVDEILTMANVALGSAQLGACKTGDANLDDRITVNEIVTATNNAVDGCSVAVRSNYVRTDETPSRAVYDSARKQLFVSVPTLNRVDVISTADARRIASISVPRPVGLDLTPDGSQVVIGSQLEQITVVDPATLQIVRRLPFMPITNVPSFGLTPLSVPLNVIAMSNGTFLLRVDQFGATGAGLVQWNPQAGTFTERTQGTQGVSWLARSADHTKALVAGGDSGGGVVLYDATSDQFTARTTVGGFIYYPAMNANGTASALILNCCTLIFLDAHLQQIASVNLGNFSHGIVFSPDGRFLYVNESISGLPVMSVFDTRTFQRIGQVPATPAFGGFPVSSVTRPLAVSDNRIVFGSEMHGISFTDVSDPMTLPTPAPALFVPVAVNPPQGNVGAATDTFLTGQDLASSPGAQVFFGTQAATNVALDTSYSPPVLRATAPPQQLPGPVNISVAFANGWTAVAPDGFTYGPLVLYTDPGAGPAAGGTPVQILGYGFDFDPSMIQVRLGGRPATVMAVEPTSYIVVPYSFPLIRVRITTPSGNAGNADLTITTPAGSIMVPRAFQYVGQIRVVPIAGELSQVVVDSSRRRAYVSNTSADRVEVVGLDTGQLLTPLSVGPNPVGLALTPDGSRLLVANSGEKTLTILDPDNPGSAAAVPVVDPNDTEADPRPLTVAATSTGKAFVGITRNLVGCVGVLREIDLTTHAVSTRNDTGIGCLTQAILLAASPDGTQAIVGAGDNTGGEVSVWDATQDQFRARMLGDIVQTLSASNANGFAVNLWLLDDEQHVRQVPGFPEIVPEIFPVYGEKMHASGALLYVPTEQGIDILDAHTGSFRLRIPLPETLPAVLDGLSIDADGRSLVAISESGVTVVQLATVPLSLGSVVPAQGPPGGGTVVTVRGSGFEPGVTVRFNSQLAVTSFVDQNTLRVTTPAQPVGACRMTITNPDGQSYQLDAASTYGE
jgi:DNA-binding beta-propeller fold protein YncE